MTTDLDRRKFLFRSGGAVGGLIASPRLGLMALLGGAFLGGEQAEGGADQPTHDADRIKRLLLRSSTPINARGEPFGHTVSGLARVAIPSAEKNSRVLLVLGHDAERPGCDERFARKSTGITTLELAFLADKQQWRHEVASHHNRRWHRDSDIPIDGARLMADQPLYRHQSPGGGVGSISSVVATPWQTVLCAERDGFVVEVNPLSGVAVRRLCLGRVGALDIVPVTEAGRSAVIYLLGRNLFKFISHQRFEARLTQANAQILVMGELFAADFSTGKWIPLTEEAEGDEWVTRLRDPSAVASCPAPFTDPIALARHDDGTLRLVADGKVRVLHDRGLEFDLKSSTDLDLIDESAPVLPPTFRLGDFIVEHDEQGALLSAY